MSRFREDENSALYVQNYNGCFFLHLISKKQSFNLNLRVIMLASISFAKMVGNWKPNCNRKINIRVYVFIDIFL